MLFDGDKQTDTFQVEKAYLLAGLSEDAYIKFEDKSEPLSQALKVKGFELIATFNHPTSKTQGFLARNKDFAVLCFRGTEQDFTDIITDLKAMLKDGGHAGFFSAYDSVKSQVEEALTKVAGLPLYVTGHSLGGALAKVFVLSSGQNIVKACYTFGSPAICTEDRVGTSSTPVFLVVNCADVVPRSLSLGPIGTVLIKFTLKIIRWVCHKFLMIKTPNLDEWLKVVKILEVDTPKYKHFGEIHFLDEAGRISIIKDSNQSLQLFFQFLSKDFKKSFEDHSISKYAKKLKSLSEMAQ